MNLTLRNDYGCIEAVIDENCGFEKFYGIAGLLTDKLQVNFTNKIDDLDTSYWDFNFKGQKLTLHYNIYDGVSIFPVRHKDAVPKDNEAIKELARILENLQ
ncbi:MAG: DUF3630 family protein [Chitinophagaceae bacterium]|nr:DUF3630 family protein [Chitinophagaceae bacterium]